MEDDSPNWLEWNSAPDEALALFPRKRISHTNLQRWYDLRIEQITGHARVRRVEIDSPQESAILSREQRLKALDCQLSVLFERLHELALPADVRQVSRDVRCPRCGAEFTFFTSLVRPSIRCAECEHTWLPACDEGIGIYCGSCGKLYCPDWDQSYHEDVREAICPA